MIELMKKSRWLLLLALTAVTWGMASCASTPASATANPFGVHITRTNDCLRVDLNGKFFTEYFYTNVPRPYCYPLIGPGGAHMTRNYPMVPNSKNEEHDHPHHRSLWFALGDINGQDLWAEQKKSGRTVHRGFGEILSGTKTGTIQTLNDWVSVDGKVLCTDEETLRFHAPEDDVTLLDFEVTLHATQGDVTFGDTKEGSFAVRVAESMRLKPNKQNAGKPTGHIVNSAGERDDKTWGRRADWCDYYGPVGSNIVGIAIFDHPANPRHPTWWHVRDYGLFAANPFGQHDFEHLSDPHAGDFKLPAGQSVTFRYRVVLHPGNEQTGQIAQRYADYVKETETKDN